MIYKTDGIKMLIKNHISSLFDRMHVTINDFSSTPLIYPDKIINNFDYILPYFTLQSFVSNNDIDRIINFDENFLGQFINQHILIPELNNKEAKEKLKSILIQKVINLIRSEGTKLSNIASSTATTLILKDFMLYPDTDIPSIIDMAQTLTNQLSSGLTIFTSPIEITRQFISSLKSDITEVINQKVIEQSIELNYAWIEQFLRDVVKLRSWRSVQKSIEQPDESRQKMNIHPTIVNHYNYTLKQEFYYQMLQIYSDMNGIALTVQPYPKTDPNKDKQINVDQEFEHYIQQFFMLFTNDKIDLPNESLIESFLGQMPEISMKNITYDRFLSILKVIYKTFTKGLTLTFEEIICKLLCKVVKSVPNSYVIKSQNYTISWIKNVIRSTYVINKLLVLGLINVNKLDLLFSELLDADPFNPKNVYFITNAIRILLDKNDKVQPNNLIATLAGLNSCKQRFLKEYIYPNQIQQMNQIYEAFKELSDLYNFMETASNQLLTSTKLQNVSTFEPIESIENLSEIESCLQNWKNSMQTDDLLTSTISCIQKGKNFYVYLFYTQTEKLIYQFIEYLNQTEKLSTSIKDIIESILFIIKGNSNVINYDMRKYYFILRLIFTFISSDYELLQIYTNALHQLRPLNVPSFTYSWIELITDKHYVYSMLYQYQNWVSYTILFIDYFIILTKVDHISSNEIFQQCYKSFLRFLLILSHDFRDYLYSSSQILLSVIPYQFIQLRNIILSISSTTNDVQYINSFEDITEFIPQDFINNVNNILNVIPFNKNELKIVINKMEKSSDNYIKQYFVNKITNEIPSLKQSNSVEETRTFLILTSLFEMASTELISIIINMLMDKLRNDCRETNAFIRLMLALFKNDFVVKSKIGICEIIAKVLCERVSTPPPHPFGVVTLVKQMITDSDRQNSIWALPFSKNSDVVNNFISALRAVFVNKK